jgi:hypothetical protein
MICLIALYMFGLIIASCVCKRQKQLSKIIFNDCLIFDRELTTAEDYFMKKLIVINDNKIDNNNVAVNHNNHITEHRNSKNIDNIKSEEHNTTRELKSTEQQQNYEESNNDNIIRSNENLYSGENDNCTKRRNSEQLHLKEDNEKTIGDGITKIDAVNQDLHNSIYQDQKELQAHNNYFENKGHNDTKVFDSEVILNTKVNNEEKINLDLMREITLKDYEILTLEEAFLYNNRTFIKYLLDGLVSKHQFVSLFTKFSLLDSIYCRIGCLILDISLIFGINAMLYTDYYIEQHAISESKVIKKII